MITIALAVAALAVCFTLYWKLRRPPYERELRRTLARAEKAGYIEPNVRAPLKAVSYCFPDRPATPQRVYFGVDPGTVPATVVPVTATVAAPDAWHTHRDRRDTPPPSSVRVPPDSGPDFGTGLAIGAAIADALSDPSPSPDPAPSFEGGSSGFDSSTSFEGGGGDFGGGGSSGGWE